MNDLEMVTACALAMGLEPYALNGIAQQCGSDGIYVADKMQGRGYSYYSPLREDAQAMGLVKRFEVKLTKRPKYETWRAVSYSRDNEVISTGTDRDLNRAIVECVSKLRSAGGG